MAETNIEDIRANEKAAVDLLAQKAINGDREALVSLCQSIAKGVLFRISCKLQNHTDAEDAAQEVLIRVCANIHSLKDPQAFGGWLNRIIINEINRNLAKNSKQNVVVSIDDYLDSFDKEEVDEEFLPHESTIKGEDRKAIMEIVKKLPERQFEAVMLHYYDCMSITEAARAMNVTKQSVARYLTLARDKIKNEIQSQVKKKGAMYNFALMPIGPLLTQVLQQEAAQTAFTPGLWIEGAINNIPKQGAESSSSSSASVGTTIGAIAPAVGTIVATAAVIAVLFVSGVIPTTQQPPPVLEATGEVVFSGGDARYEYLNPTSASAQTSSDYGALTVHDWEITVADESSVLYSGEGGDVSGTLVKMRQNGEDGKYTITFMLEDAKGGEYKMSRSFLILNDTGAV